MTPLSVVMAVHNGAAHLGSAIESILGQTVREFEFLIVDDASTDDTAEILEAYARRDPRIRVLRNPQNLGPYPSANRAFSEARRDVIARQDADDLSPPDRLAIQLRALETTPGVSLVTGAIDRFQSESGATTEIVRSPEPQPVLEWELLFRNAAGAGAQAMFPRVVDGWRVSFEGKRRYAEDYALFCRLARLGRIVSPADIVYRSRQHDASITRQRALEQDACAADVRYEYQQAYLPAQASREPADAAARFWNFDSSAPLAGRVGSIDATLRELRARFLDYAGRRYGAETRSIVEAHVGSALEERIGYWLFKSTRRGDVRALRGLMQMAAAHRVMHVAAATLRSGRTAIARRSHHSPPQAAPLAIH